MELEKSKFLPNMIDVLGDDVLLFLWNLLIFIHLAFISWHLAFYPASVPDPVKTEMLQRIHSFLSSTATWFEKARPCTSGRCVIKGRRVDDTHTTFSGVRRAPYLMEINSCSCWLQMKDVSPIHISLSRVITDMLHTLKMINRAVVKTFIVFDSIRD